jgi:Polyketide cyclase / dehydrase and lipid transport
MTVLSGHASADLGSSVEQCWAVIADVARWPEWQRVLETVTVIERDAQGRPAVCDTVSDAKLKKILVRVGMAYDPPHRLAWSQIHAEDLDSLEGSWELESLAGGGTRATYRLAVDPGRVGIMARPMERLIRPLVIGHQPDELAVRLGERK